MHGMSGEFAVDLWAETPDRQPPASHTPSSGCADVDISHSLIERHPIMHTNKPNAGRPAFYTIRQTAWILGVKPAKVSRAIRTGTLRAVRQRSGLMVPASELTRLLGHTPTNGDTTTTQPLEDDDAHEHEPPPLQQTNTEQPARRAQLDLDDGAQEGPAS
jgi:Helix-turn-helix domain